MKQEIIRIELGSVNCYLGKTEEGFVLFDTGGNVTLEKKYDNRREKVVRRLEEEGCVPGKLKAIILTHGDSDHITNAAYLRDKYNTIIAMHENDIDLVDNVTLSRLMMSFKYRSVLFNIIFKILKKQITKMTLRDLKSLTQFRPDVFLKDQDMLTSYGFMGEVIHTPGHTPGSIAIFCEGGELIAGDTFANLKKPSKAPNAIDFKQLDKSIKRLEQKKITTIYPGHGDPFQADKVLFGRE